MIVIRIKNNLDRISKKLMRYKLNKLNLTEKTYIFSDHFNKINALYIKAHLSIQKTIMNFTLHKQTLKESLKSSTHQIRNEENTGNRGLQLLDLSTVLLCEASIASSLQMMLWSIFFT